MRLLCSFLFAFVISFDSLAALSTGEGVIFGIRLGEENGGSCNAGRLPNAASRNFALDSPLFGIETGTVSLDLNQRPYSITINGAFRRGLSRDESLERLNSLRSEVIRRVGIDVGEYSFSTKRSEKGIVASRGGLEVWKEMDTVYARCVATNQDIEVSISCSVNSFHRRMSVGVVQTVYDDGAQIGGGDSRVPFSVVVTKLSLSEAEKSRRQEANARAESQRRQEQEHEELLQNMVVSDFYGVHLDQPSDISTNNLVRKEADGWSASGGCTNHYKMAYWEGVNKSFRPAEFFDYAKITYSYETISAENIFAYGHFPTNVSRRESVRILDNFVCDLEGRYGIELGKNSLPVTGAEPKAGVSDLHAIGYDELFYQIARDSHYYCREFHNKNLFVRLSAGVNLVGVCCTLLEVSVDKNPLTRKWEGIIKEW